MVIDADEPGVFASRVAGASLLQLAGRSETALLALAALWPKKRTVPSFSASGSALSTSFEKSLSALSTCPLDMVARGCCNGVKGWID
jgi:hypothetical protein